MKLFQIAQDYTLELNRPWIRLIPEFETIIRKDKGSTGDYRGDLKLKARQKLGFVYLLVDFASPFRMMDKYDRREASLLATSLKESDVDEDLQAAIEKYEELQLHNSRALKTLTAIYNTVDRIDDYFASIDLTAVDRKGELLHDSNKVIQNIKNVSSMYEAIKRFEQQVEEDLAEDSGIRGNAEKGDNENTAQDYSYNGQGQKSGIGSWRAAADKIKEMETKAAAVRTPAEIKEGRENGEPGLDEVQVTDNDEEDDD